MAKPKPEAEEPGREPKVNPEVDKRLDQYIAANRGDHDYYAKLVKENPERAVRVLLLKDMKRHEDDMKLVERQLPQAKEWFEKQSPQEQQKIKDRLASVNPYYADKAFVGEVLRAMGRQNRQTLMSPVAGMGVG